MQCMCSKTNALGWQRLHAVRVLGGLTACRRDGSPADARAGPFGGTPHVAALLDRTMSRPLRGCLLRLLEALLTPAAARTSEPAARAARANAAAFVEAGGVPLAVDLVAGVEAAPVLARNALDPP